MKRIVTIIIVLVVIALGVTAAFLQRTLGHVSESDPTHIGNTAGNINNGGVFLELDDKIYFANPYDNEYLYQMDPDLSHAEKLMDVPVSMLNGAQGHLFYYQDISRSRSGGVGLGYVAGARSLTRMNLSTHLTKGLDTGTYANISLMGNYLYLENYDKNQSKMDLVRIDLEGNNKEVLSEVWINPAGVYGGNLYYNGTQKDHYLYSLNGQTKASSTIFNGDVWYPTPDGDYIYYLDVANKYRLCRFNLTTKATEQLTQDSVDLFNVKNGVVVYSRMGDHPALVRLNAGTGLSEQLADGAYEKISMAGNYAFFRGFGTINLYYAPLNGPAQVSMFAPTVAQ